MATVDALNNCVLNITPSRKRKRHFEKFEQEKQITIKTTAATTSCFTNAAFCSTPKKFLAKRRIPLQEKAENDKIFSTLGLEMKSIADSGNHCETKAIPKNPYEVQRKPPKKRRRCTKENVCFENAALNLELPEKLFNPFEVVRDVSSNERSNCFSNPALNLKVEDASVLCNPFEIQRSTPHSALDRVHLETVGQTILLNPFIISPKVHKTEPCQYKLGLPFVPTLGARLDFKDISLSQLKPTPQRLLAEGTTFSIAQKAKVSLGSIEEETSMDIGKELDRYQLELENSINEAKLRKTAISKDDIVFLTDDCQLQEKNLEKDCKKDKKLCTISEYEIDQNTEYQETKVPKLDETDSLDKAYDCSAEDQEDDSFRSTTLPHFVRVYTKPNIPIAKKMVSKEYLDANLPDRSTKSDDEVEKSINVKNIRKSIRKLMHISQQGHQRETETKPEYAKNNGFLYALRNSIRRKSVRNTDEKMPVEKQNNVSIIDSTERTLKLKSNILQTEYTKINDFPNEKKSNLRNSITKSTREVRSNFLKSIFCKTHEEYNLKK